MNNHDDRKDTGGAAFPLEYQQDDGYGGYFPVYQLGMDLRPYAAIHLRIPDSGIDWLDEMIAKAERRDIAVTLLAGDLANSNNSFSGDERAAEIAYGEADTMLKERDKGE